MTGYCGCALDGLQEQFTEDEFLAYEQELIAEDVDPAEEAVVAGIIEECNAA